MDKHVITVRVDVYADDAEKAAELVNIALHGTGLTHWTIGEYPQAFFGGASFMEPWDR